MKLGLDVTQSHPTTQDLFQPTPASTISCAGVTGGWGLLSYIILFLLLEMWSDRGLSDATRRGEGHGGGPPPRSGWRRLQSPGGGEEGSVLCVQSVFTLARETYPWLSLHIAQSYIASFPGHGYKI